MSQTDITVILTVYNQRPESIETSMRSVAAQTGCTYQLLVADDHSSESFEDEATALASELGISNFTYVRHPENVQTVRNILHALPYAEGQFIKALGAGDALYDESTLAAIVAFCRDNDVHAGFGDIVIDLPDRPILWRSETAGVLSPRRLLRPSRPSSHAALNGRLDSWLLPVFRETTLGGAARSSRRNL